uniref:Uncharacterized protein n=1 Tax=Tanacetum cinerariifolium TaxID=118510 RepID=A0A6L2LFZ3_TANCI|nr:hypothetical protein [Tanacetum cinerariifolium]
MAKTLMPKGMVIMKPYGSKSMKHLLSVVNLRTETRLQKIVSQLAVLCVFISQEDLNLNFLRSLPSEWNTHVVVWRNKSDLDTISIDDLYNNFKIVEQEVKGTTSINSSSQNMAFVSSPSPHSTNEVLTAYGVSTVNLSDATVYAFLSNQSNGFQLVDEDLEQIYEDDIEEMDLNYVAEDEVPTNMALMDFLDYEASKSLDKLIGSQLTDKSRKGVGFESYNDVPPPLTGLFSPPKIDFSYSEIPNELKESLDSPLVKNRVSDNKNCTVESSIVVEKKTIVPTVVKIEFVKAKQQEKPVRKPIKYAEMYRERMVSKNNYTRVTYNNSTRNTHPNAYRNNAPRAVLMKTGLRPLNTARPRPVNTARPRPVNTVRPRPVTTARPNSAVANHVRESKVNAVKASACWVWRPTKPNGASITLKRHNYIDSHPQQVQEDQGYVDSGCSRHMIGNMSYLSYFKEFHKGYVTFGGGANGGRVTGKGTIHTEATHADFLGDQPEGDMSNINTTYQAPSTLNTRIHKDHSLDLVIGDMDVKSVFLYERIEEGVCVCQPLGFEDPDHPDKVYKVVKALYGLHQAPRAWYETLAKYLLDNGFHRGKIDQTLFIKRQNGDLLFVQILDELCGRTYFLPRIASTPVDKEKPLVKDADGDDVDVHLYRSMIGSLMYLITSRPDIIDSPFELVAYTDSNYAGASLDNKSTIRGYQFLGRRLISWQYKKQIVVTTSTTEAEYVAATSRCGQALTENPTIYTSLIQQFWQTAAANTLSTEEVQITATINGKVKLVSEASIRRRIKLDDSDGISTLPNTEIFEQLALMGLEAYLKYTKEMYGAAYTKLIMKVKRLEKTVKASQVRRGTKIVVSDDEELQDPSKQGRKVAKVHTYARRRKAISIASGGISTDEELVSTAGASMPITVRLQVQLDEEERQRTTRVHEEASSFNVNELEDIQATIEVDEELALKIQAEEREKYSKAEKARLLVDLINQRKRYFAQQRTRERRNKPMTQAQ